MLTARRHELSCAAAPLYPRAPRVAGTDLLTRPQWLPDQPLPLDAVALEWVNDPPPPVADGLGAVSERVRPWRVPGERFASYAEAVAGLDKPALFENRICYRLLEADLAGDAVAAGGPRMRLSRTRFFEALSVGHALAHEFADVWDSGNGAATWESLPLRASVGDPCALSRRPAMCAVTTLTLRRERGGDAAFLLHWRDPAKVAHAGGAYQVMPVGVFQPAAETPAAEQHDLSLWRAMGREFSEEFLGTAEIVATGEGRLDYDGWPFYQRLSAARASGSVSVWCLGIGVDPLTIATDILTVAVFDAAVFDDLFANLVAVNAEGEVLNENGSAGIPFTEASVARFSARDAPVQAACAALLRLAWQHREHLLG